MANLLVQNDRSSEKIRGPESAAPISADLASKLCDASFILGASKNGG